MSVHRGGGGGAFLGGVPLGGCLFLGGVWGGAFLGGVPFLGVPLGGYFFGGCIFFEGGVPPNFRGGFPPPEYGQRSAGTHPTGMHSCQYYSGVDV